ncbi:hypothetical protein [Clostridium butyricum]|uniref:hypothetical protein n=1 Tax=Clostridium butyricum TaxID=1492 RepID=UPI00290783F7|nr:hypothetical protein [Clostridium butyricum]
MNEGKKFLNSMLKQKCEKCGKEDTAMINNSEGQKVCFECKYGISENSVKLRISEDLKEIIRKISIENNLYISAIIRSVLTVYKNNLNDINKQSRQNKCKDRTIVMVVKLKEDCNIEEYQKICDEISDNDIMNILKDLYR